jgi:hypothetical protein
MPHEKKSALARWFEKVGKITEVHHSAKAHAHSGAHAVRQAGEAVVVGAVLGAIHAELKGGLDPHGIPIDATIAAVSMVGAIAYAGEDYAADLRNVGSDALAIFTFRKTDALLSQKKAAAIAGEVDMAGEMTDIGTEDPVVAAARAL